MIYPRASDLLQLIEATIVAKIDPVISTVSGKSASASVKHLLRDVEQRIAREGKMLGADIQRLQGVLEQAAGFLRDVPADQAGDVPAFIARTLEAVRRPFPDGWPTLDEMAERVAPLREALYQTLKLLVALRPSYREDSAYQAIRQTIRDCLVWQVDQEDRIIAPAYYGHGPRR